MALSVPATADANSMRIRGSGSALTANPATSAGRAYQRAPASVAALNRAEENKKLFSEMKPGDVFIIQNSVHELDDEVVIATDIFEDGTVRVKRSNGRRAFVKASNLASTLSPEVECGESHDVKVCKGDRVFYPVRTASLDVPEAPITHIFANGSILIRDGGEFIFDLKQVGKPLDCSPQREGICTGDYVFAEGFREDRKFNFEGPIEKAYTHGIVLVKVNGLWRYPIDVKAVKKRIASENPNDLGPNVISTRGSRAKDLPFTVIPEVEPLDPNLSDSVLDAR